MVKSPAGRRARRADGPTPEQWLEVPGWRRPVDTLLVLAVTFATAWVGLVVIPAAANSDTGVTDRATETQHDASPPSTDPTTDPSQWFAGPVYTGGHAAPATQQVLAEAPVVVAPQAPAPRAAPRRTTTHAVPRTTTRRPAPTTTTAAAAVAAVTTPAVLAATTTTEATTAATTTTAATSTSEPPSTSTSTTTESTTTSTTTSSPPPPPQ